MTGTSARFSRCSHHVVHLDLWPCLVVDTRSVLADHSVTTMYVGVWRVRRRDSPNIISSSNKKNLSNSSEDYYNYFLTILLLHYCVFKILTTQSATSSGLARCPYSISFTKSFVGERISSMALAPLFVHGFLLLSDAAAVEYGHS